MAEEKKKEEKVEDPEDSEGRVMDFLQNYLQKSMRIKPDKWQKMMATDDKVRKIIFFSFSFFLGYFINFHT